jgi:hypothetical protein
MKNRGAIHSRLTERITQPRLRTHPVFGKGYVRYPTTAAIRKELKNPRTTIEERNLLYTWLRVRRHTRTR